MSHTRRRRWLIIGLLSSGIVIFLRVSWRAFCAWQLRHSYWVDMNRLRPGEHFDLLYSPTALGRNKALVREWIAAELLLPRTVDQVPWPRCERQMRLLGVWGELEDLEILWRKGEQGFPLPPTDGPAAMMEKHEEYQEELCASLVMYIEWACHKIAGSQEEGSRLYREGMAERRVAPEVRRVYQKHPAASSPPTPMQ